MAENDSYNTAKETILIVEAPGVLANDTHVDNKPLAAILVDEPSHVNLELTA